MYQLNSLFKKKKSSIVTKPMVPSKGKESEAFPKVRWLDNQDMFLSPFYLSVTTIMHIVTVQT